MKPSKIILVAHDFSVASRNALELAAHIAQQTNSTLFVYHVVSTPVLLENETAAAYSPEKSIKEAGALLRRGITYLRKRVRGINIALAVDYGFLVPSIAGKVEELDPWLTVLGVKKRTGLDRVVFGDVSKTLVGKIKGPMMVIPLNYKKLKLNKLVYAWDGKSSDVEYLSCIKEILGKKTSTITALNITHYEKATDDNINSFKAGLKKLFTHQVTELKQVQGLDKIAEFEKSIRQMEPDMVIVYAHHYNLWESVFHQRFSRQIFRFIKSPLVIVNE
jgi:nucleotide-binding universal stress UspA family protein